MNRLQSILFKLMLLGIFTSLLFACSKEPLSIKDVPFEELESSFYELNENTIEITEAEFSQYVEFVSDYELIISKDLVLASSLSIGDIIVTDMSAGYTNYYIGRTLSVDDQGNDIIVRTEDVTMVQAYKEYYYDSSKPNLVEARSSVDMSEAIPTSVIESMVDFMNEVIDLGKIEIELELSGILNATITHPHTSYRLFGPCAGSQKCFDELDQTDSNNNGVIDVVEIYYSLTNITTNLGFYTFSIDGLKIEELNFVVKTGEGPLDDLDYNIQEDPKFMLGDVKNKPKGTLGANRPFSIYYIPTPLNFGAAGIFIPIAPVLEIDFNASAFTKIEFEFPNSIDLNLGHINFPSVEERLVASKNGKEVPISTLFSDFSSNLVMGVSGSIEKKLGIAFGGAISSGGPNKAGVSTGGLLSLALYNTIEGDLALVIPNIQNFAIDGTTVSGSVCFDMGISWDTHLFVDDNLAENFLGDLFDIKFTIPKEKLGFKDISLFDYVDLPDDGDEVCFKFSPCINATVTYLHIGQNSADEVIVEFRVDNPEYNDNSYNLVLSYPIGANGEETSITIENLNFGFDVSEKLDIDWTGIYAAYINEELKVTVDIPNFNCEEKNSPIVSSFSYNCENAFVSDINLDEFEAIKRPDVAGNDIIYLKFEAAQEYVGSLNNRKIPTLQELELFLSELDCINPTGIYLPPLFEGDINRYTNGHLGYFWVSDDANTSGSVSIAEVDFIYADAGTAASTIKKNTTHPLTSLVALIPVDQ